MTPATDPPQIEPPPTATLLRRIFAHRGGRRTVVRAPLVRVEEPAEEPGEEPAVEPAAPPVPGAAEAPAAPVVWPGWDGVDAVEREVAPLPTEPPRVEPFVAPRVEPLVEPLAPRPDDGATVAAAEPVREPAAPVPGAAPPPAGGAAAAVADRAELPEARRYCPMCGDRVPIDADGLHCHLGHRMSPAHAERPRRGLLRRLFRRR